jgi:peptidyl-prolyl cis-trans isomerase D
MKNAVANKVSYFILTFIFLIIIASFLFSNFDNFSLGSSQQVASVDGTPVTTKEYSNAFNRQLEFYNQMMGGSGMTQKQIEEMRVKESVLNELIQQKLVLNTADQIGLVVSLDEIKSEIKSMSYFKTNDQFDVNRYRNMLQGNGYVPSQFEELVADNTKQKKVEELFRTVLISENFVNDIVKFKNNKTTVLAVKIGRQDLAPLVSVSEQEIKDYLSKPENKKAIETAYTENFSKYNKPEEVKARHILIKGADEKSLQKIKEIRSKVNVGNFSQVANKETQDTSGQSNGGDLGWFAKGRMVPEFEKVAFEMKLGEISEPVKTEFGYHLILVEDKKAQETKPMDAVKSELALMELQKTKAQDLDKLLKSTNEQIHQALGQNDVAQVEGLTKKVEGQIFKDTEINQYDQNLGSVSLTPEEAEQVFGSNPGAILNFGNPGTIFLVKILSKKPGPEQTPDQIKNEVSSQREQLSRKVREEFIKDLNGKAKIVTNQSLL